MTEHQTRCVSLVTEIEGLKARVVELEGALQEALRFVRPIPSLLVKEMQGDIIAEETCQIIRDTRDRLTDVLKGE